MHERGGAAKSCQTYHVSDAYSKAPVRLRVHGGTESIWTCKEDGPGTLFYEGTDDRLDDVTLHRKIFADSNLNHPNISTGHDAGEDEGRHYSAMEYVEGSRLCDSISQGGLEGATVIRYGVQLASALAHAHERGFSRATSTAQTSSLRATNK